MTWSEVGGGIVTGLVSGVLTAAVWSVLVWAYSYHRNRSIEKALAKAFFPRSITVDMLGGREGFPIKNESAYTVVVREVVLFELMPDGHESLTVPFAFDPSKSQKACKELPGGWVELPPSVRGTWIAPSGDLFVRGSGHVITGCRVLIEYKTLLGATKLLKIQPPPDSPGQQRIAKRFNAYYGLESKPRQ